MSLPRLKIRKTLTSISVVVFLFVAGSIPLFSHPESAAAQEIPALDEEGCPIGYVGAGCPGDGSIKPTELPDINPIAWIGGVISDVLLGAVAGVAFVILYLAQQILSLAGIAFDFSVKILVFEFASHFGNSDGLLVGWRILRDIGNILLLFGFVAIGVQTILNINHFSVGKTLPRLVIFAILLNFSLFVAEALIDGSNGVTTVLYEQAYNCTGDFVSTCGIGSEILSKSGMGSLVKQGGQVEQIFSGNNLMRIFAFLMLALFMTITAFTLFAGAILLVTRAVVLVFLMVTSPIGFASMAIPQLNKVGKQWWGALMNNVLFAPAYLVLIFVSLKIMESLPAVLGTSGAPDLIAAVTAVKPEAIGTVLIPFLLMIGFMILSIMMAKQFSIAGADFATQTAGNLSYGAFGFLGRRTIGRTAYNAAQKLRRTEFARGGIGRLVVGGTDAISKGSFDVRSSKTAASYLSGGAAGKTKVDIGRAQSGGFDHIAHAGEEELEKYGKSLRATPKEEAEKKRAEADVKTEKETRDVLREGQQEAKQQAQEAEGRFKTQQVEIDALVQNLAKTQAAREPQIAALEEKVKTGSRNPTIQQMNIDELETLKKAHREEAEVAQRTIDERKKTLESEKNFYTEAQKGFDRSIKASDERIKQREEALKTVTRETNPQRQFAEQLIKELKSNFALRRTAAPEVYEHVAHKLDEWADKSGSQKALDELVRLTKQGAKDANANAKKEQKLVEALGDEVGKDGDTSHAGH